MERGPGGGRRARWALWAGRGGAGLVGVLAVLAAAACGGGPPAPGQLEPGGELCYRFEENAAARSAGLPWGLALSGDPVELPNPGVRRSAHTLREGGDRSFAPFASWRPLPGDSVQVGPLVTGSLQLRLAVEEGALRGMARPIGDVVRPGDPPREPIQGVVARATACPVGR